MARFAKPCTFCKGRFDGRCIICGHGRKAKTAFRDLSKEEQLKIIRNRNRKQFLHELDSGISKGDNCSTWDCLTDHNIGEHREWALDLYYRYESGETCKSIAEKEGLTVSQVKQVVQLVSDKLVRGDMEIKPKPPLHVEKPPLPEPPPPRKHLTPFVWEEEEEE